MIAALRVMGRLDLSSTVVIFMVDSDMRSLNTYVFQVE